MTARHHTPPTQAVIVAAGLGSRLGSGEGPPKPLRRLVRVPLIARVMRAAAQAGITHFVVVIGYRAEELRHGLPACVPPGCSLEVVENPRFEEPNGVSLQAAAAGRAGAFALLMADHLFTPDRLAAALHAFAATGRNLLVVEGADHFTGDPDDATRVLVAAGHITAISKGLDPYDAVDTGMFVLDAAETSDALDGAGPSPSISDGMRRLAEAGRLDALDVRTGRWQDVDTPEDLEAARGLLYETLRKKNDGFLATHINRRISLALSTRLWRLGMTPNGMTLLTLCFGLLAGWVFARGSGVGIGLLGATLFQLQSVLDGVDGELARLLHRESRVGFWLDVGADNLTHVAVFLGLAQGQATADPSGPWTVLGIVAALGVVASFAVMAPLLRRRAPPPDGPRGRVLAGLVDGLARRDFTYALFPLALLGWLGAFVWAAAIGTWAYATVVLWLRWRSARSPRAVLA